MKNQKLNILFRTSGGQAKNKQLGFGHVFRCTNLAQELSKNNIFFLVQDYGQVKKTIINSGFKQIFSLPQNSNLEDDLKKTINIIKKENISILIIDKYKTQKQYIKKLRNYVKVVYISDLEKNDFPADLIFNGFIGFSNKIFYNKYGTKCFIGPSYQILHKNFYLKKDPIKKKFKLLVTFGGFDEHNLVRIFLKNLQKYPQKLTIKIILGPGSKLSQLNNLKKNLNSLHIIKETKNMYQEIASCEYGLCSGGITSYEFATMNVPFAIICQVKHQLKTAQQWEKKQVGLNLGLPDKNLDKKLCNFLDSIISGEHKYPKRRNLVDGLGAKRISKEILKLKR